MAETTGRGQHKSEFSPPMLLAYMICMAMFGNGATIGTVRIIIHEVRQLTRRGRQKANTAFFAAGSGATSRGGAVQRFASSSRPARGTATAASGSSA